MIRRLLFTIFAFFPLINYMSKINKNIKCLHEMHNFLFIFIILCGYVLQFFFEDFDCDVVIQSNEK